MDYESKNHSKYLLIAHVIFVCKYRKPLLTRLGCEVKSIMLEIAGEYGFCLDEMEVDKDHIHLLVRYSPAQSLLWLVRTLKQLSTYRIWRLADNEVWLARQFWKERTFWSDGYFACSTGNVSTATIARYIQNQG